MPQDVAYGFIGAEHLFGQRIKTVGVDAVRGMIEKTTTAWNEEVNAMVAGWVQRGSTTKERVILPGAGTLQPLDELGWGNPLPTRETGFYDVGYPIQGAGDAWGTNRLSVQLMTVEEANRQMLAVMRKDAFWLRQHMLSAVLTNNSWIYPDKFLGDVSVKPLANGDEIVYLKEGTHDPATANHYLAQAAAITDATNPFGLIYDMLLRYPSNSGPYVVFTAPNLKTSIEGLQGFVKVQDNDIEIADTRDRLRVTLPDRMSPGGRVYGKINFCTVVEWRALPDGYMIAVATGAGKFLRMREWDDATLQGLFPEYHSPDGNLNINRFIRYAGFGVYNRVAALAYQIGNASYVNPAGFTAPLP